MTLREVSLPFPFQGPACADIPRVSSQPPDGETDGKPSPARFTVASTKTAVAMPTPCSLRKISSLAAS